MKILSSGLFLLLYLGGGKEERNNKIMTDYIKVSNRTFPEYEDYDDPGRSLTLSIMLTLRNFSKKVKGH